MERIDMEVSATVDSFKSPSKKKVTKKHVNNMSRRVRKGTNASLTNPLTLLNFSDGDLNKSTATGTPASIPRIILTASPNLRKNIHTSVISKV